MLDVLSVAYRLAPVRANAVGGAEQVLALLDRALVAAGHRSTVLACEGSSAAGALETVPIGSGPLDEARRAHAARLFTERLERLLGARDFDVVHFHGADVASYPFDASWLAEVPKLVTLHLPVEWYPGALFSARPRLHFNAVSAWQWSRLEGRVPACEAIDNGVDLHVWHPEPEPSAGYFFCLGRICPEKSFDLALRAARAADVPLMLAGEVFAYPDHQRYFDEQIAPLLDRRRRFVGPVSGETKRRWLANASAVLVPSRVAETCSLVTLEALACGTPVITSGSGAPASLITPGITGLVAATEAEWADAFGRVGRLSRAACRRRAQEFDARRMARRYLELYGALARSGQRRDRLRTVAAP
jgi:glycosyltransferase involved in cell wall biosynthesis